MSGRIFRIFNPAGPKEDPVEKRRAQVRRAQQTYRARKDRYTKSLEQEVTRARESEANLLRQTGRLRGTIQQLIGLLVQNGIDTPADIWAEEDQSNAYSPSSYHLKSPPSSTTSPSPFHTSPIDAIADPSTNVREAIATSETGFSSFQLQQSYPTVATHREDEQSPIHGAADNDAVTEGMEFVLALEEPCLAHIHGDPNKPQEANGHALTASAHLLCLSPQPVLTNSQSRSPQPLAYDSTPSTLLERLLSLSPDLSSTGEVTPVQAWNYIRRQPHVGGLGAPSMRSLAEKLRHAVKCHGFGAVVDQVTCQRLVMESFLPGRAF